MKIRIIQIILAALIPTIITSCSSGATHQSHIERDTVQFKKYDIRDSIKFDVGENSCGTIKINASVKMPTTYSDSTKTKELLLLFSSAVLNVDSIKDMDNNKIIKQSINSYVSRFYSPNNVDDESAIEDEDILNSSGNRLFTTNINIYPIYNKDGILSVCKKRLTKNNNEQSMIEHQYFNFNLMNMLQITLNDIFREDAISEISGLLKEQLMKQLNVTSDDALNDLGYFNLDNMTANNNFTVSKTGLKWTFLPLEIGCFVIGETSIELDYNSLVPLFIDEDNIFSQYIIKH